MADPAKTAAELLAWEMKSWRSIEIETNETFRANQKSQHGIDMAVRSSHRYVETAAGQRMLEERLVLENGKDTLSVAYKDKNRGAQLHRVDTGNFQLDSVIIERGFAKEAQYGWYNCPAPLLSFYCGLRPLHLALVDAKYLGTRTDLGHACNEFLIPRSGGSDPFVLTFALEAKTATPLHVAVFASERDRVQGRLSSAWKALSFDEVEGRHLALHSEHVIYSITAPNQPEIVRTIDVAAVRFDRDYPDSLFWPKITPETQVVDLVAGKTTGSTLGEQAASTRQATAAGKPPITATPAADWTSVASAFLVVVGAGVILAAYWKKRRG